MTEIEAIGILVAQFNSSEGFLAKLQSGQWIDFAAIEAVREALSTLREAWARESEVPKSALLPLVDAHSAIQDSAHLYPGREAEISRLAGDISQQIEKIFPLRLPEMSEVEASALVYGHFRGSSSLALTLYMHEPLEHEWIEQVLQALEVLAKAWEHREYVPKAIAGSMLQGGELVRGYEQFYPDLQLRWGDLADMITSKVKHCLG